MLCAGLRYRGCNGNTDREGLTMNDKKVLFKDIPINRNEIEQSELNIENKTRSNLFNWNGQFSPQFIEALLNKYAEKGMVVIDPFLGSGTVLSECARKGLRAYGTELNASAYYMAKTYEISNLSHDDRQMIIDSIDRDIARIDNNDMILDSLKKIINETQNPSVKNIISTLIIVMDIYNNVVTMELLTVKWEWLKQLIKGLPYSKSRIRAEQGDARKMSLPDSTADLLITSPPYINVLNYHQKYRSSVEALGYDVLKLARSEFGSNRKNRGNRFLTVIQYCIDIALSLKEAIRVCKSESRMIYVVGRESTVLGCSFCNSELIYEMAQEIFGLNLILRQERVFKNRYGTMIYEDILHFENNKDKYQVDEKTISEKAREIAVRMLKEKKPLEKNEATLHEAISFANKVKKSEVVYA